MKIFQATTTINASPETIWSILTDAPNYPAWDPYAERIEGRIALGEKIKAFTTLSPGRAFPVTVSGFTPGRTMIWGGGMPLGLFKGVGAFTLTPKGDSVTDFAVREEFSGPLLPLIGRSLPDMTEPFQAFAAGLKARAEGMDVG